MAERVYRVSEVAEILGRVPHTIRMWELNDEIPKRLRSTRDERGWRVWTDAQVQGLEEWLRDSDRRPGKGLKGARP